MPEILKNSLLLTAALLALIGGYWVAQILHPPESITSPRDSRGDIIEFALPDLEGKTHQLNEWRGKVIVLNFWASWCPPCREEIPLFIALQKQYGARGLQISGVAIDSKDSVLAYQRSAGMNYPILIGDDDAMQVMARYGNASGSLPFTVILDPTGRTHARKLGAFHDEELMTLIEPLINHKKSSSTP